MSRDRDSFQLKFVSAEAALDDMKRQKTELEELNNKFSDAANTIELQRHEISALKVNLKTGSCSLAPHWWTGSLTVLHLKPSIAWQ